MSAPALWLAVIGAATATGWVFRLVDAIERPGIDAVLDIERRTWER